MNEFNTNTNLSLTKLQKSYERFPVVKTLLKVVHKEFLHFFYISQRIIFVILFNTINIL